MNIVLNSVLGVCKFIGYKTCSKVAGLYVGKKALLYGAQYVLGSFLPMRLVKCVVAVAPYTPAAVVLATGGSSAIVANTTYIVISQLSEYVFVCAVRRAAWTGAKTTLRIAKYVFITRPLGLNSGPLQTLDAGAGELLNAGGLQGMEEGWVLVDEELAGEEAVEVDPKLARGAIHELMHKLKAAQDKASPAASEEITEEMLERSLLNVTKVAKELKQEEGASGVEFVDGEGVVFEDVWDQSVHLEKNEKAHEKMADNNPRSTSPHPEDQEFVMV